MKSPACSHIVATAVQAALVTKVSSLISPSSIVRVSVRWITSEEDDEPVVRSRERDGGEAMRALTDGQMSFISGRKLFSFLASTGSARVRRVRSELRRKGDGEER
jgi:hypothetical protein